MKITRTRIKKIIREEIQKLREPRAFSQTIHKVPVISMGDKAKTEEEPNLTKTLQQLMRAIKEESWGKVAELYKLYRQLNPDAFEDDG